MKFVGAGILALILAILAAPSLHMNILGAVLIVVFGFLFVTVSSRLTGESLIFDNIHTQDQPWAFTLLFRKIINLELVHQGLQFRARFRVKPYPPSW